MTAIIELAAEGAARKVWRMKIDIVALWVLGQILEDNRINGSCATIGDRIERCNNNPNGAGWGMMNMGHKWLIDVDITHFPAEAPLPLIDPKGSRTYPIEIASVQLTINAYFCRPGKG